MEKILFVVDHLGVDKSAFDFACYVAQLTKSTLTGLFLEVHGSEHKEEISLQAATSANQANGLPVDSGVSSFFVENNRAFALSCSNRGIRWTSHDWPILDVKAIIEETRFADLLILSSEASLKRTIESPPTALLTEILFKSECPVIVSPINFTGVEEIVLAYDGSPSSMSAIKQFTYLLPELSETRVMYVQVKPAADHEITEQEKMRDFLKTHYSKIGYHLLHGNDPGSELFSYLVGKKDVLVVMGAYGRNAISTAFKKSTSELLLNTNRVPVFVSHR